MTTSITFLIGFGRGVQLISPRGTRLPPCSSAGTSAVPISTRASRTPIQSHDLPDPPGGPAHAAHMAPAPPFEWWMKPARHGRIAAVLAFMGKDGQGEPFAYI